MEKTNVNELSTTVIVARTIGAILLLGMGVAVAGALGLMVVGVILVIVVGLTSDYFE